MKFNKLAKELDLPVNELADKVTAILPNANGGTEVSDEQKMQIVALIQAPTPNGEVSLLAGDGTDPILSIFIERIEQEEQLETPEQLVDQMISRYLANPEDLPDNTDYREAIIAYVDLVKKRHTRRQQQSSRLRSLLNRQDKGGSATEPLALESFYSSGPPSAASNGQLGSSSPSPQLAAASS
ncbi:MAG: hypothetical protein DCF25_20315 [Leptolyngbya foveolarum]|uniref:Uncharacterized protein n=1 Tax=Leptolyngbya foveolarum TaxID=47253 RepID=A0A2W4TVH5_9CYAN|nr:MAG: hypothetical protein DCF25_20315 [Leptolyngbya foveolarum]